MFKRALIATVDKHICVIYGKDILRYDIEYAPNIARFDYKDGSFIEFTRANIVSITIEPQESEEEVNLCDKCNYNECSARTFIGKVTICKEYEYRKEMESEEQE